MPRLEFLNCLKVVSPKVPNGLKPKASLRIVKGILKRKRAKIFVRTFAPKKPVQTDLWIFNSGGLHDHVEKRCFFGLTATFGSRKVSLKSIFKALGRKIIFCVFNQSLLRKYVFWFLCVIYSQDAKMPWLLIRIVFQWTRTKVVSRKVLNGLNRKTSLSKGYSKRRAAKYLIKLVSRLLELAVRKSRCKCLHV